MQIRVQNLFNSQIIKNTSKDNIQCWKCCNERTSSYIVSGTIKWYSLFQKEIGQYDLKLKKKKRFLALTH